MKSCEKHPKYKGRRKPRTQCEACLSLYVARRKPRVLPKPTKVFRDKSKYSRKVKHKEKL